MRSTRTWRRPMLRLTRCAEDRARSRGEIVLRCNALVCGSLRPRAPVRFFIDECLTVELVTVAGDAGYEVHHVAHVGKAGWKDWNVLRYACENDSVLVTNNAADFRKLYANQSLHAGLVILIPNVTADLQKRLCGFY